MARAHISKTDGRLVLVLPDDLELHEGEVEVSQDGANVLIEPVPPPADDDTPHPNGWSREFLALAGSIDEEIPRPSAGLISEMRDPFAGWEPPEH